MKCWYHNSWESYKNPKTSLSELERFKEIFDHIDISPSDKLTITKYFIREWTNAVLRESTEFSKIQELRNQYDKDCEYRYFTTPFSGELKMDQHIEDLLNSYHPKVTTLEYKGPIIDYNDFLYPPHEYKFRGWDAAKVNIDLADIEMTHTFMKVNGISNNAIKNIINDLNKKSEDGLQFRSLL